MKRIWSIRSYKEGDEEGTLELYNALFPVSPYAREQWVRYWHWMYKENPCGQGWIWVAEDAGKIVGHSSIIPIKLKIANETIRSFQSINTMTHPDYQCQGIYQALAKRTYAEAAKEGVFIGYRFPNENSHPIAIKRLNWLDVSRPRIWFRPYHWRNAVMLRVKNRVLAGVLAVGATLVFNKVSLKTNKSPIVQGLTIVQASSFDERINEFWDKVSNQSPIMVVRDKSYLNWKYFAVPSTDYLVYVAEKTEAICGYVILRCIQHGQTKVGRIFDILAESVEIAQRLIAKAVGQCEKEGIDLIYCNLINDSIYVKALRKNGFAHMPFIKGGWFCVYSVSPHISGEFLSDSRNWYVQMGDSDKI